ncbi:mechanosensitive ion channel family protein [Henriciella sp.]|uniref:mechanosensitive ion channel family protein n=1 Tax=Henriciella sp. TaxID=1968823 RepID=UPI002609708B|nr:mechanosensitive ion channel family protein [Henriciella sp.]
MVRSLLLSLLLLAAMTAQLAHAQDAPPAEAPPIAAETANDGAIEGRLTGIYDQIDGLSDIEASVEQGVVTLSGTVTSQADAARAAAIAERLEGVVTVQEEIVRDLSVDTSLSPAIATLENSLQRGWEALPLVGLAIAVFLVIALIGTLIASWTGLWRRLTPNPFLAEIAAQAFRFIALVIGLVVALNLLGATALMGAILGGAGVIGLAIGFAVRDTVENYISSIMLSLRQPFRANDHVLINEHEGKVVRLTSRATILMTLDGNHLRIPNSTVFKAVILNYTRNPERRFQFTLGVDAEDDPVAAMATGLSAISGLDFVLNDPKPDAIIETVGDSNIVLRFFAWVDQRDSDFMKARSLSIRAAKDALETAGFTLPEPIYRLRFDNGVPAALTQGERPATPRDKPKPAQPLTDHMVEDELMDVRPDDHITEKVEEERAHTREKDLLDPGRPVE